MNLRRIKHILLRLSTEEKVLGIGALMVIVSAFMPWYSVASAVEQTVITQSGFSGDMGVIGFVVFLLTLISLAFLLADHIHFRLPKFGYRKEQIILFLMGEAAFLSLLIIAVYTKRSFDYTNAELRFGVYLSLIGSAIGTFAAYAEIQKQQKKTAQDFFNNPEDSSDSDNNGHDDAIKKDESKEASYKPVGKTPRPSHKPEQKNFFYEKNSAEDDVTEDTKNISGDDDEEYFQNTDEDVAENQSEEIAEEQNNEIDADMDFEMTDEKLPQEELEIPEEMEEAEQLKEDVNSAGQGSYFIREAGVEKKPNIKINIESITPAKKPELHPEIEEQAEKTVVKNESPNQKMSFYDDL
jgi:hypothetical protein